MIKKKGQVEVQFNWVFSLILGIIILSFFIGVSHWYKKTKDRELAYQVLDVIDAIIASAGHSEKTSNRVEVPNMRLVFDCDPDACNEKGCASNFGFREAGSTRDTPLDVIFSPESIQADFLSHWTLDFSMPFRVTNFLYITNPRMKYVLSYDPEDADSLQMAGEVHSMMEDSQVAQNLLLVPLADMQAVGYNNEYLLRFVVFSKAAPDIVSGGQVDSALDKNRNWDVLFVRPSGTSAGELSYGLKSEGSPTSFSFDSGKSAPFYSLPALIGAVFTEDYRMYVCNMKKAYIRAGFVAQVYAKRTGLLDAEFSSPADNNCDLVFNSQLVGYFDQISAAVQGAPSAQSLEDIDYASLSSAGSNIERLNRDALYRSCPNVY